jgi:hypothetical protein
LCQQGRNAIKSHKNDLHAKQEVHTLYRLLFGVRRPSVDRDIRESSLGVYLIIRHPEVPRVSKVETQPNRTKATYMRRNRYIYYISFGLARIGLVLSEIFVKVALEYTRSSETPRFFVSAGSKPNQIARKQPPCKARGTYTISALVWPV